MAMIYDCDKNNKKTYSPKGTTFGNVRPETGLRYVGLNDNASSHKAPIVGKHSYLYSSIGFDFQTVLR